MCVCVCVCVCWLAPIKVENEHNSFCFYYFMNGKLENKGLPKYLLINASFVKYCCIPVMSSSCILKTTTLMYENIICFFSFPFITGNVRTGRVIESRRRPKWTHRGDGVAFLWNHSIFQLRSAWVEIFPDLYNFPDIHAILVVTSPTTRFMWTYLPLACHPHNSRSISAGLPHLRCGTCVLFPKVNRCTSCCFSAFNVLPF